MKSEKNVIYTQKYPLHWKEYEFIDSGNNEKCERFGRYILRRPEPQALWQPYQPSVWKMKSLVRFEATSSHAGLWLPTTPDPWEIAYHAPHYKLRMKLTCTQFKHIGLFPEQAENWDYAFEKLRKLRDAHILNLFAYTGGMSLACALTHSSNTVTHLDAIKQVVSWAKQNAALNNLQNIRWIIDDALVFVKREVKRGKKYQAILMDPPAYGNGPHGEKWLLSEHLPQLLQLTSQLLDPHKYLFILNTYSLNLSPIVLENLIAQNFQHLNFPHLEIGELCLKASHHKLPTGIFARFTNL